AVLAEDRDALLARLAALAEGQETVAGVTLGQPGPDTPRPVFVYAGQGTQWWAMARGLLGREPVFDAAIDACEALFAALGDWSLRAELLRPEGQSRMDNTAIAQPAIFAVQVALTQLWASWGIHPSACVGHSVGEVAAAWAAGVLDLPTAARVIFHRGRCMEATPHRGRMLAAALPEAEARALIAAQEGHVSLGAVNSPGMVTLAGDPAPLQRLADDLAARGVFHRFLQVNYAFHSAHMDPVRAPLLDALGGVETHPPRVPLISTVTARPASAGDFGAAYWWRNVREPVLFGPAITALAGMGFDLFLEVGAHPALAAPTAESTRAAGVQAVTLASLRRNADDRATLIGALSHFAVHGQPIDWDAVLGGARPALPLPREVWQRQRYWHESDDWAFSRTAQLGHPLIDRRLRGAEPAWALALDRRRLPWLDDHRIQGHAVFPAAGYLDMMVAAAQDLDPGGAMLDGVDFQRMLTLPEGETPVRLELRHRPSEGRLEIFSREGAGDWVRNAAASLRRPAPGRDPGRIDPEALAAELPETVDPEAMNATLAGGGLHYGPAFRGLVQIRRGDGAALARIEAPAPVAGEVGRHVAHPALLDACFQLAMAAIPRDARLTGKTFVPVHIGRIWVHKPLTDRLWAQVSGLAATGRALEFDLTIADETGAVLVRIDGYRVQAVSTRTAARHGLADWLYEEVWLPAPRPETPAAAAMLAKPAEIARAVTAEAEPPRTGADADADRLAALWAAAALRRLGWRPRSGQRIAPATLARDLEIRDVGLLALLLEGLRADGVLERLQDGAFRLQAPLPRRDPLRDWRRVMDANPGMLPELTVLRVLGNQLPDLLRGRTDLPTALAGAGGAVDHLMQSGPSVLAANRLLAQAVAAAIAPVPAGRRLRILELAGRAGGLAHHVLPRLQGRATRYVLSDRTTEGFGRAEKALFDHRDIAFATLDPDADPLTQGFEAQSFDLILGLDALRPCSNPAQALEGLRGLLAPGGILALAELPAPTPWAMLVLGLTEGWRFTGPLPPVTGFDGVDSAPSDPKGLSPRMLMLARAPLATAAASCPPADGPSPWLILGEGDGLAADLATSLAASGRKALIATQGPAFARLAADRFTVDPANPAPLLEALAADNRTPAVVIDLRPLDAPPAETLAPGALASGADLGAQGVLRLVQVLGDSQSTPPRLVVVTRGAHAPLGTGPVNPAQAPVWGLARVAAAEYRQLAVRGIDLDPLAPPGDCAALIADIDAPDDEGEIALRGGGRFVSRIRRLDPAALTPPPAPDTTLQRLEIPAPGALDRLAFAQHPRRAPGPSEVEIAIAAAALNFRDVMKAMGIYPVANALDELPGDEAAGTVTRVGAGVRHVAPGDRVLALGAGCLATHATLNAALVLPLPEGLSFDAAATIPVAYLTAWHALHEVGRLRRGDTVLIHAATGGVGLAAIRVAQAAGARVFATAGSSDKRAHLRALGIEAVMDSRRLDFVDDIHRLTDGRGVDLVLNALAGRAIEAGLAALAPGGRFLEIGKRDIFQNTAIGLRPFRHGISLTSIDLHRVMTERPAEAARALRAVLKGVVAGRYGPLPHRVFAMDRAVDAFRLMSQARHIGKIVLRTPGARIEALPPAAPAPVTMRADATYLITGGLGGLGLVLAEHLIGAGARHLILVGRSGASRPAAQAALARWQAQGIAVRVEAVDVSDPAAVAALFDRAALGPGAMPPIRGLFHAATVLDDAVLAHLTPARLDHVLAPKAAGAWILHRLSQSLPLDHFVMFSSVAQLLGARGQGNYVAANAVLVALAQHRRALGLPALAVDWGPIAGAGLVADSDDLVARLDGLGLTGLPADDAIAALRVVMASDRAHVSVARIEWTRLGRSLAGPRQSRFAEVATGLDEDTIGGGTLRDRLTNASPDERAALIVQALTEQVAQVLRTSPVEIDAEAPLTDQGLDSLMAIDLVLRIETAFEISVPTSRVGTGLSVRDLAAMVLDLAAGDAAAETPAVPAGAPQGCLVTLRKGDGVPLFLIHPSGGRAAAYAPLVQALPQGTAVCALISRRLVDGGAEFTTLQAMAGAYADLIAAHQPQGAIRLAGFSFGGFAAMAVAHALQARGREIALIGVLDADPAWLGAGDEAQRQLALMLRDFLDWGEREGYLGHPTQADAGFAALVAALSGMDAAGRTTHLVDWLRRTGRARSSTPEAILHDAVALFLHHIALAEAAPPEPLIAPAIAVASNDARQGAEAYRAMLPGLIHVEPIATGHFGLLANLAAGRIARLLTAPPPGAG
ncbi:MAG: SDR family NAD(P)-dependent oxidoreductase, partial [Rhodobacteraceae bacterium]|nr:SDR family NAD(P)-dependent oxidoreductase [Paracoccaceae bacterium]